MSEQPPKLPEPEKPKQHPDALIDEVKSIIEGTAGAVEAEAVIRNFMPYVVTISFIRSSLIKAGYTTEVVEQMALAVWNRWFPEYQTPYAEE